MLNSLPLVYSDSIAWFACYSSSPRDHHLVEDQLSSASASSSAKATKSPEAAALALRISHSNSLRARSSEPKNNSESRPSMVPATRLKLATSMRMKATKFSGLNHTAMRQAIQIATATKKCTPRQCFCCSSRAVYLCTNDRISSYTVMERASYCPCRYCNWASKSASATGEGVVDDVGLSGGAR